MKKVYEDAMVEYKKTIKKDPTNAQAYFNLKGTRVVKNQAGYPLKFRS